MTSQEPKKRGRPKKVVEAQKEINPDCKPATRGYVKCIARRIYNHNHKNDITDNCIFFAALSFWFLSALSLFGLGTTPSSSTFGWYPSTNAFITGAIVLSAIWVDIFSTNHDTCWRPEDDAVENAIQKYTSPTPVCAKRKECE